MVRNGSRLKLLQYKNNNLRETTQSHVAKMLNLKFKKKDEEEKSKKLGEPVLVQPDQAINLER